MYNYPDQSFSKVIAALLAGAVFTAITVSIRDWSREEPLSVSNTPTTQQSGYENSSAPNSNSPVF
jgi:hypothetical protein